MLFFLVLKEFCEVADTHVPSRPSMFKLFYLNYYE